MIAFAFLDSAGIPTRGGSLPILPDGAVPLPAPYGTIDLPRLMYVGGVWQERPRLPMPVITAQGFEVAGLPDGARLIVSRLGSEEQSQLVPTGGLIRVDLLANGTFEIQVTAPRPWLGSKTTIIRGTGSPELAAQALTRTKTIARARINDAIGTVRLKYVTDIPGQQTIYTEKQAEARSYLTTVPAPATLADYPLLAAEVGVTAPTARQLAQVWANKAVLFKQVAAITEKLRMQAAFAIEAAPTEAAVDAAVEAALTTLSEGPLG